MLAVQVGLRQVVIEKRQLLVNRKPVMIKGVNRHEHDERRGKAVTEQGMLDDVLLLKQLNFNAVRCSHYPNAVRWLVVHGWPILACTVSFLAPTCIAKPACPLMCTAQSPPMHLSYLASLVTT